MDSAIWAILLLLIGLLLLVAEVFIPSGGIILVLAIGSLLASLVCAYYAWLPGSPRYFWTYIGSLVVLIPGAIGLAFHLWPSTPIGKRALLEGPSPSEIEAFTEQAQGHESLIGKQGVTVTSLNPAGMAVIDGHRVHCQSEGMVIESRSPIKVIAAKLNGVIVRQIPPESDKLVADPWVEPEKPAQSSEEKSFDFDLN